MPGTGTGCLHGLELLLDINNFIKGINWFQCPHGLELLPSWVRQHILLVCFNALSGLSCYRAEWGNIFCLYVSMPSRAWVVTWIILLPILIVMCFNALSGLSCYVSDRGEMLLLLRFNALSGLYLISTSQHHNTEDIVEATSVNALSGWYLISTVPLQKPRFYAVSRACFCRYLSEYSDNSRFSCMLTFWTYLMRCTYPWHWIKYSTKYNRCHPIFSLSW